MADGWRNRALWAVATSYAAIRLLIVAAVDPTYHPDTASYQVPPSFMGHHSRPWVVPLVQDVLPERGVVVAQALLGAIAFVALAIALASTLRDWRARTTVMAIVLLLGVTPRVTYWDAMMLSESVAISLTALLVAALVCIDRIPAAVLVGLVALWVFTRDGHLYLAVLLFAGLIVWGWRHQRLVVPIGVSAVLVWGFVAAANDDTIEGYNVAANMAHRISADDGQWLWFQHEGMPDSDAFDVTDPYAEQADLIDDPMFWQWSTGAGPATYARFLLGHPLFTLGALGHMVVDGGIVDEALVDHTNSRIVTTHGPEFVWPREASYYTALLALVALLGSYLVARSGRLDRRWLLPALLTASSVPHAMLAYHSSPFEIARHGVILSFVLVVTSWWVIALVADTVLDRSTGAVRRSAATEPVGDLEMSR